MGHQNGRPYIVYPHNTKDNPFFVSFNVSPVITPWQSNFNT
jgi:hypothetical protein